MAVGGQVLHPILPLPPHCLLCGGHQSPKSHLEHIFEQQLFDNTIHQYLTWAHHSVPNIWF